MNQQRAVIYTWRNDILTTETPARRNLRHRPRSHRRRVRSPPHRSRGQPRRVRHLAQQHLPRRVEEKDFNFQAGFEEVARASHPAGARRLRNQDQVRGPQRPPVARALHPPRLHRPPLAGAPLRHRRAPHQHQPPHHRPEGPPHRIQARGLLHVLRPHGRIKIEIASGLFRTSASITAFESFLRNLPAKTHPRGPSLRHEQPRPHRTPRVATRQNPRPSPRPPNGPCPSATPPPARPQRSLSQGHRQKVQELLAEPTAKPKSALEQAHPNDRGTGNPSRLRPFPSRTRRRPPGPPHPAPAARASRNSPPG